MDKTTALKILGLSKRTTEDEIKKAYREMIKKYHPDKNPGREEEVREQFNQIQAAYEHLKNHPPENTAKLYEKLTNNFNECVVAYSGLEKRRQNLKAEFENLTIKYHEKMQRKKPAAYIAAALKDLFNKKGAPSTHIKVSYLTEDQLNAQKWLSGIIYHNHGIFADLYLMNDLAIIQEEMQTSSPEDIDCKKLNDFVMEKMIYINNKADFLDNALNVLKGTEEHMRYKLG